VADLLKDRQDFHMSHSRVEWLCNDCLPCWKMGKQLPLASPVPLPRISCTYELNSAIFFQIFSFRQLLHLTLIGLPYSSFHFSQCPNPPLHSTTIINYDTASNTWANYSPKPIHLTALHQDEMFKMKCSKNNVRKNATCTSTRSHINVAIIYPTQQGNR